MWQLFGWQAVAQGVTVKTCDFRKKSVERVLGRRKTIWRCTHPDKQGFCPFKGNVLAERCPFYTPRGQKLLLFTNPRQKRPPKTTVETGGEKADNLFSESIDL